jgi:hypothetical protein
MLDETQCQQRFGNVNNFSYLNIIFAPVRQSIQAKGYRPLTDLFFIRVLQVGEIARKKLSRCERRWDLIDFPDILL